ncbi:unnamed protein product, partial [Strongylus vulgaris]
MVPFDLINSIYADDHDLFIRMDSSAMLASCLCNNEPVHFDVTQGERANSLLHHIVLRANAANFCALLFKINKEYFSKLLKPFAVFSKDLKGAISPQHLRCQAKIIVSQNSRLQPSLKTIREPYALFRRKYSRPRCDVEPQIDRKEAKSNSCSQTLQTSTLSSGYSLPQIPTGSAVAELPALKLTSYHQGTADDDFRNIVHSFEALGD